MKPLPLLYKSMAEYMKLDVGELEEADHMPHPETRRSEIPVYCLCKFTPDEEKELLKGLDEPDYVEPTGMTFRLIPWKKDKAGTKLDMLRISKRLRKGLLVFVDRESLTETNALMTDYLIWDDGWGEDEEIDGMKGEGLKWGRMELQGVLNAWLRTSVGDGALEDWVGTGNVLRWGRLESGN